MDLTLLPSTHLVFANYGKKLLSQLDRAFNSCRSCCLVRKRNHKVHRPDRSRKDPAVVAPATTITARGKRHGHSKVAVSTPFISEHEHAKAHCHARVAYEQGHTNRRLLNVHGAFLLLLLLLPVQPLPGPLIAIGRSRCRPLANQTTTTR